MGLIRKLVIYTSEAELKKHAAGYPCLVNFDPFTNKGTADDGCGHFAAMTFVAVDPASTDPALPTGPWDNVEFIGFPLPTTLLQQNQE